MNIRKQDVNELRRRMTRKSCTIDRFCGCYVNSEKRTILSFTESFSDLEEDEFYKYLEIAKKAMSGSIGANLLELNFQKGETGTEHQRYLYTLKASRLDNPELTQRLYDLIIESYQCAGNYLILLFHDVYDVITKAKDNASLEASDETFEYMICAVCPVNISKPGLSYHEDENRIGACDRSWVVGAPEIGFTYPAFANRSADASAVMYYVKTGCDSHAEFVEDVLGCGARRTSGEEKTAFRAVIENAFEDDQEGESVFLKVQKHLSDITAEDPDSEEEMPPMTLTAAAMADVMEAVDMPSEAREIIQDSFEREFGELLPTAQNLVDKKLVEESEHRLHTAALETKITDLEDQLDVKDKALTEAKETVKQQEAVIASQGLTSDDTQIALHVSPAKAKQVHLQSISGVRCLVVPIENGETASINGVPAEL